jgi:hypothetical protein
VQVHACQLHVNLLPLLLLPLLLLLLLQVPADFSSTTFTSLLPQGCSLTSTDAKTWSKVVPRILAQRFATLRLAVDKKKVRSGFITTLPGMASVMIC